MPIYLSRLATTYLPAYRTRIPISQALPVLTPSYPQPAPGYSGPGTYRVLSPNGLTVYLDPRLNAQAITNLSYGTAVTVRSLLSNGWVEVVIPTPPFVRAELLRNGIRVIPEFVRGYICMTCNGGPWLAPFPFTINATLSGGVG